jgi:hypothetical protein
MVQEDRTPLSERALDAYDHVKVMCADSDDSPTRADVHERLIDHGFEPDEADHVLDQLLNRGYLYQVGEAIRVTPE